MSTTHWLEWCVTNRCADRSHSDGDQTEPTSTIDTLAALLAHDSDRFVRACAAEALGCAARRAAAIAIASSDGTRPSQQSAVSGVVAALLPGLELGGEEVGQEGGPGDAWRAQAPVRDGASSSSLAGGARSPIVPTRGPIT